MAPPSALYRRISLSFLALALILLGVVLSFSFSKATVIIKPKREALTANLAVEVRGEPATKEVKGTVAETTVSEERRFTISGDGGTVSDVAATGKVVVKNTTGRDQPLVKTTRLLAPDGKLFRLAKTVLAPARGEVTADAYADVAGKGGEIEPTHFTIPGLAPILQDKIYADSSEPFCCGTKTVRLLTEEDFTKAEAELTAALLDRAKTELRAGLPNASELHGEVFLSESLDKKSNEKAGDERSDLTLSLKLKVDGVFYDSVATAALAREELNNLAGFERELVELDPERTQVTVLRADADTHTARLNVDATGMLVLRPGSSIFDKQRISGLDAAAAETYFKAFTSIESVRVEFFPMWLKRIPKLKDHIEIRIEE